MTADKNKEKEPKKKKKKKAGKAADKPQKTGKRKKQKKQRSMRRIILAAILSVFAIALFVFLFWYSSFETVSLEDYVAITYSGYNTKGTAHLSLKPSAKYGSFLDDLKVELLSDNGKLQNGDQLSVYFVYNQDFAKEQGLRVKADSCQITVAGLPEGKPLSVSTVFDALSLTYEGIAPELTISLENTSSDPFLQTIVYQIEAEKPFYDLGDTFTITASFSESLAVENQYICEKESNYRRQYSIENRERFVRDASELSAEHLQTLHETAAALLGDANEYGLRIFSEANLMPIWVNGKTTFKWSNPRLLSTYLNVLRPEYFETSKSHNNDLKLVYLATLSQEDGTACDAEVVVQFTDLIQKADGTLDLALDSGRIIAASYKDSHIKDLVFDSYAEEYEAEKIP